MSDFSPGKILSSIRAFVEKECERRQNLSPSWPTVRVDGTVVATLVELEKPIPLLLHRAAGTIEVLGRDDDGEVVIAAYLLTYDGPKTEVWRLQLPWSEEIICTLEYGEDDRVSANFILQPQPGVNQLIGALHDESEEVRQNAVQLLGTIKDPQAFQPLIEALYDEDVWVRYLAVQGLANIRDARAVEPLTVVLCDENVLLRRFVVEALGEIGPSALKPLIEALHDNDEGVRHVAALALGQIGRPAVDVLIEALHDEDRWVRSRALKALVQIDEGAVEALVATLSDPSEDVQWLAVRGLAKIRDTRAVQRLTEILIHEKTSTLLCHHVVQALVEIGKAAVKGLIALLRVVLQFRLWARSGTCGRSNPWSQFYAIGMRSCEVVWFKPWVKLANPRLRL
jgi:hypothetical protein